MMCVYCQVVSDQDLINGQSVRRCKLGLWLWQSWSIQGRSRPEDIPEHGHDHWVCISSPSLSLRKRWRLSILDQWALLKTVSIHLLSRFVKWLTHSPLADEDLTKDFWQYALIDQQAINAGLKKKTVYNNIICSQVPKGNDLSSELYAEGQKTNANFEQRVHDLQTPGCGPSTWFSRSSTL